MKRALLATLVLASVASGACAPSSFDDVTGGSKEGPAPAPTVATQVTNPPATTIKQDDTLAAPRPISPVSVSLVSTARPRLKWAVPEGQTGALVELCQDRAFKTNVKSFTATGHELVVPEDLALGIWFWRLKGSTSDAVGTTSSPIWEVLVRGPAAHGTSDAPSRGMVDLNGDGEPDLLIEEVDNPPGSAAGDDGPYSTLLAYAGDPAYHSFTGGKNDYFEDSTVYTGPLTIGGGTDFDGDGLTDVIQGGALSWLDGTTTRFAVDPIFGTVDPVYLFDVSRSRPIYFGDASTVLPSVSAAGDVDGDGYGDSAIGTDTMSLLVLGGVLTGTTPAAVMQIGYSDGPTTGHAMATFGNIDANGDGLADLVFSYSDTQEKTAGALLVPGDAAARVGVPLTVQAPQIAPIAYAAGDFNGDGIDDLAFTIADGTSTQICISFGDTKRILLSNGCIGSDPGETDFGLSLTAVDLEGDGVDELLATTKTTAYGVLAFHFSPNNGLDIEPIASVKPGVGVRLTTLWPGRPGVARWAAAAADGTHVDVFNGLELTESLVGGPYSSNFGRGLR